MAGLILICVDRLPLSCLWWFEDRGGNSSRSGGAEDGFLLCPFYLLCIAGHSFYRDGKLSLAATLPLPQSQPRRLCVPVHKAEVIFESWTIRKELLGCGSARAGLWGEIVT